MNDRDIKIDLGAVQTTLLLPLYARAQEAEKKNPILCDTFAKEVIDRIDYDFSKIETAMKGGHQLMWAIRAFNFDNEIRSFLKQNSKATIINIGAGLDTTFQRIDNGSILWINIDLQDVAALRERLIPDSEREITIAKSVLDFTWIDDIALKTKNRSILIMSAGVLCYFEVSEIETLFRRLADVYPLAHMLFDAMSMNRFFVWATNRELVKKAGLDSSAKIRWTLKKASHLKKLVNTIKIIDEYSMFSRIPIREDWSKKVIWDLKMANLFRLYNMVHVQF